MLAKLKASRASKIEAMQALLNSASAENRELTAEETTQYDTLMAEQNSLKAQIERAEVQANLNKEMTDHTSKPAHVVAATNFEDAELVDDKG